MSQADILTLLENHPEHWFSAAEIIMSIPIGENSLRQNLMKIRRSGLVEWDKIMPLGGLGIRSVYVYRWKP